MHAPSLPSRSPEGGLALGAALVAGLAVLGLALVSAPEAAPFIAAGLAAALVAVGVGPRLGAEGRLIAVVALSVSAIGADQGADPLEIAFGVSLVAYVCAWAGGAVLGGQRFLRSWPDVVLMLFLVIGGLGGIVFALIQGHTGSDLRSDITCLLALALYFPAREVCIRSRRGPEIVAGCILGLGVVATVISGTRLYGILTGAAAYYEIVDARVSSGEVQAMGAFVVAMLWASASSTWRRRLLLLAVAGIALGGLVLARSRSQWIAGAFGLVIAGGMLPPRLLARLVPTLILGTVAAIGGAIAMLGQGLMLFATGLLRRFMSISSAFTTDISVLNRYEENAAAWAAVAESPLVGHGWGAPVSRLDLISGTTTVWGFLHNGYAWIAHKTGFIGLAAFLFVLVGLGLRAGWAARTGTGPDTHRAMAAAGAGLTASFLLLAYPANPFTVFDQMVIVSLALALASGTTARAAPSPGALRDEGPRPALPLAT